MDTNMVDDTCSICLDVYTNPKLLPCSHTFCVKCLQQQMRTLRKFDKIICPLCRQTERVPEDGINGFITNFYCEYNRYPEVLTETSGHKQRDFNDHGLPRMYSELGIYPMLIATKFHATLINSFICWDQNQLDGLPSCMNGVYGTQDSDCWTIPSGGPFLIRYHLSGAEKERIRIPEDATEVFDSVHRNDGSLLVTCPQRKQILLHKRNTWSTFASIDSGYIIDLSSFNDGRIVVAVKSLFNSDLLSAIGGSELLVFSKDGLPLPKINSQIHFQAFAIDVNKKTDCVCMSDTINRCVWIISDSGALIGQYRTELSPLGYSSGAPSLEPVGISTDTSGNVYVVEKNTMSIHVLNSAGKFLGTVVTDNDEQFGHPFSLHIGMDDVIWLGDRHEASVRVFKVTGFINNI